MASGSYIQVYVQCPFYHGDNGESWIICEGLIPGTQLHSSFPRKSDYRLQIEVFCCDRYRNCEVYTALLKKYEEEEQDNE